MKSLTWGNNMFYVDVYIYHLIGNNEKQIFHESMHGLLEKKI